MGHNVGKAAENAVKKSSKESKADRTAAEIVADIRKNVAARLAVTFDDTVVLLNEYDALVAQAGCQNALAIRKAYRIFTWISLVGLIVVVVLVLHKSPAPNVPYDPAAAKRVEQKFADADQAKAAGRAGTAHRRRDHCYGIRL